MMPTHERHSRIVPTTNHSLLVCKRFVRPPVPGSFDHQSQLCGFDPLVLPAKFESKTKATHRKSSTRKTSAVLYLVHNTQSGRRQLNPQSKFFYWQLRFRPFQNPNLCRTCGNITSEARSQCRGICQNTAIGLNSSYTGPQNCRNPGAVSLEDVSHSRNYICSMNCSYQVLPMTTFSSCICIGLISFP